MDTNKLRRITMPALLACAACSGEAALPRTPPTQLTRVVGEGFERPGDAVASPDGTRFYFTAFVRDAEGDPEAAVMTVAAAGGPAEVLQRGGPLHYPVGLVLSCDGGTLYVADPRTSEEDVGAIYAQPTSGGAPTALAVIGIGTPSGLALADDCRTLHVSGRKLDGTPALFRVATSGGEAEVVHQGEPFVSPSGLHVDGAGVTWMMDQLAGEDGSAALFAVDPDGTTRVVAEGLSVGTPAGVSLVAGGGIAVIPTEDSAGKTQLTTIEIESGKVSQLAAPDLLAPGGLRTARRAGVLAVVDSEANAIYRAQ